MTPPVFILHSPQMGENIGAAARVMANFGHSELRLVAPRDGWPNPAAETMSAGALPDRVTVTVFDQLEPAILDCSLVIATTARPRGMEKPVLDLPAALARIGETQGRVAILFGAERTGLPNEAVTLSDAILSYPVSPGFGSLNLAQAVAVAAHGLAVMREAGAEAVGVAEPASREELLGMMEHFEEELDRAGFFHPDVKKPVMIQNLRNAFSRAGWTEQEVRTFRGAIKALALGRGKHRVIRDE